MSRKIYRFYCYQCNTLHSHKLPCRIDTIGHKIKHIYCPKCNEWIPLSQTNLSPDRFKVVREDRWVVIDQDAEIQKPLYKSKNQTSAASVCKKLNSQELDPEMLYHSTFIFTFIKSFEDCFASDDQ